MAPQECRGSLNDALLTRLFALNHERATKEKRGLIRWPRQVYQNSTAAAPQPIQGTDPDSSPSTIINPSSPLPWPDRPPEQVAILRKLIGGFSFAQRIRSPPTGRLGETVPATRRTPRI